jgi:manganese efflux pump family protein
VKLGTASETGGVARCKRQETGSAVMGTKASRAGRPGRRWRGRAAKLAVTGALLAGAAAGCSSQPAAPQGSVSSCFQFAATAIHRHTTVTAVPPACRGLSRLQVNVAVGRALHDAAAGARGKVRQRQIIARDSSYVAGLTRAVAVPSQPVVAASSSGLPGRTALGLAALIAWLVTVGLGLSMMARWITRIWRHGTQPRSGRGPVLNFAHAGLALTGLLIWISYLATDVIGLAWAACGFLVAVASLGMTLLFLGPATTETAGQPADDPPPAGGPPVPVIAAHITLAVITILLAALTVAGSL